MSDAIGIHSLGEISHALLERGFREVPVVETPRAIAKFVHILQRHTPAWYFKECEFILYPEYEHFFRKNMCVKWPPLRKVVQYQLYDLPRLNFPQKYTLYGKWSKRRRFNTYQLARFTLHHNGGRCRLYSETNVLDNPEAFSSLAIIHCPTRSVKRFKKNI